MASLENIPKPEPDAERKPQPDYLPARMVNEFSYCPRLFFYEWVEGVFQESADTVEGAVQHKRVDRDGPGLPAAEDLDEDLRTRSVTLSSETHRLIARMDLLDVMQGVVTPVDYKRGRPREGKETLEAWPSDRVQLAVQGIILRENGYECREGIVYYAATKQRVRVELDEALVTETLGLSSLAWTTALEGVIPPPLEDSPKCPGCSLVSICLPGETNTLRSAVSESGLEQLSLFPNGSKPPAMETRRLVTPRSELRPAYVDTQGLRVGKSGEVLQVKDKETLKQEIRMGEISQLNLMGNIQITTQAVQSLCGQSVPVCYFSQGGWFYGITAGMNTKNVFLRKAQYRLAEEEWFCLRLARKLVAGKIRNQRTMLLRNHVEPDARTLAEMKTMVERAETSKNTEELLGVEGNGARAYFQSFGGMLKSEAGEQAPEAFRLDFHARNRRPPRDAVNALLSLGYSMLAKDLTVTCYAVGFDPLMGFYHQPRYGRPALALDLMEPFRPLIVDSAVLNAINTRMVTPADFLTVGKSVALKPSARKAFYRAYELRMDTLVTHPRFDYRVSYRRLLEIQARLLARWIEGEVDDYFVFVTR
ncbi:MAG: CRISPR-associated endonuclease Cas1 [Bryobacterales bacterium]|nr:CRISPR-associated endonuclease Cas1 [Bryobacterales bacterium]